MKSMCGLFLDQSQSSLTSCNSELDHWTPLGVSDWSFRPSTRTCSVQICHIMQDYASAQSPAPAVSFPANSRSSRVRAMPCFRFEPFGYLSGGSRRRGTYPPHCLIQVSSWYLSISFSACNYQPRHRFPLHTLVILAQRSHCDLYWVLLIESRCHQQRSTSTLT